MGPKMAVCIRTLPPTPAQVPAGSWGCRGEVRWEGVQEGIEGHRPLRLPLLVYWHGQTLSFRIRLNTQQMQSHLTPIPGYTVTSVLPSWAFHVADAPIHAQTSATSPHTRLAYCPLPFYPCVWFIASPLRPGEKLCAAGSPHAERSPA